MLKKFETFHEKDLRKTNQIEFRTEQVIKRKDEKTIFQMVRSCNSFNSWIHKKISLYKMNHILQNHILVVKTK